jgi:hypothetical protein
MILYYKDNLEAFKPDLKDCIYDPIQFSMDLTQAIVAGGVWNVQTLLATLKVHTASLSGYAFER